MIGSTIGDYQIVRLIGRGGMGAVYEAFQPKIGRRAALKTLLPELADEKEFVARFFNEARAVNAIRHPGIVQVSDLGETPDGGVYLVMELLEGETLSTRTLRAGRSLPQEHVLRIGWQIASTLHAAHGKGIVHRDIKPSNIMIVPDPAGPGGERVKVLDFGIAKLASSVAQTRSDQIMGTLAYISPEQIRSSAKVDAQSDVYSLGAMLFHLLSGRPPFVSPDGDAALITMHLSQTPPELRGLVPELSAELSRLIARMLDKNPLERPTMAQVSEQLQHLDVGASARSLPPLVRTSLPASKASPTAGLSDPLPEAREPASLAGSTITRSVGQTIRRFTLQPVAWLALGGLVLASAAITTAIALRSPLAPRSKSAAGTTPAATASATRSATPDPPAAAPRNPAAPAAASPPNGGVSPRRDDVARPARPPLKRSVPKRRGGTSRTH